VLEGGAGAWKTLTLRMDPMSSHPYALHWVALSDVPDIDPSCSSMCACTCRGKPVHVAAAALILECAHAFGCEPYTIAFRKVPVNFTAVQCMGIIPEEARSCEEKEGVV
jgi:hypothetical protein